jgi:tetratricopeptide (TPR) repeat protein
MRPWKAAAIQLASFLLSLAVCNNLLAGTAAYAEATNSLLTQAIAEYKAGDYSNSAGHFYAVLTTEFNNPRIHYYMASCYAHLNDTESAVREFRIAYALAPQTDVGYFATKALKYYGVGRKDTSLKSLMEDSLRSNPKVPGDSGASTALAPGAAPPPIPPAAGLPAAPAVVAQPSTADQSISLIKAQLEREKSVKLGETQHMNDQLSSQRDERMDRVVSAIGGRLSADPKQRERDMLTLPDDVRSLLDTLKRDYDGRATRQTGEGRQKADALEESANNLKDLIEKDQMIDAAGSNLYVRNYKTNK